MSDTPTIHSATDEAIARSIGIANIPALLMVLYQMTGDDRWLADPYRPQRPHGIDDNDDGGLPEDVQAKIRGAALDAIQAWRAGAPLAVPHPQPDTLVEMLSVSMSEPVPPEYGPMVAGDLAAAIEPIRSAAPDGRTCVIIGAGVSGIGAAIRLGEIGVDCTVVERRDDLGGTWYENRYPGAGVDTPSHLYEYSFAPHDWPHYFATRDEVHKYLGMVADRFGVRDRIRFGTTVESAVLDETRGTWALRLRGPDGAETTVEADFVVSAVGAFNAPKMPEIAGMERFQGVSCHTARWTDPDLDGKRVAVIGNGASAMQAVPAVVDRVAALVVFQRSPHWIAPFDKLHRPVPDDLRVLMREVPLYRAWYRQRLQWQFNDQIHAALQRDPDWPHPARSVNATNDRQRAFLTRYLHSELDDRDDLVAAMLPSYPPYGKRMLFDNGWYRAMRREHVTLETDRIAEITETGIVTEGGTRCDVDVIVYATGFDVVRFLSTIDVRGRGGMALRDVWDGDDARAYFGAVVPGFPNFFMLYGPNTQPGHGGSLIGAVESQITFVTRMLASSARTGTPCEVSWEQYNAYSRDVDAAHDRMIWTHPGMDTYYRNSKGRVVVSTPYRIVDFWTFARSVDVEGTAARAATGA